MFLPFLQDIVTIGNIVLIKVDGQNNEGEIVKLSSELVAIKTPSGQILVFRDDQIEDFRIISSNGAKSGSISSTLINKPEKNNNAVTSNVTHSASGMANSTDDEPLKNFNPIPISNRKQSSKPTKTKPIKSDAISKQSITIGKKFDNTLKVDCNEIIEQINNALYILSTQNPENPDDLTKESKGIITAFDGAVLQVEFNSHQYAANINAVIETDLYSIIKNQEFPIKVDVSFFKDKNTITLLTLPKTIREYFILLKAAIEERHLSQAKSLAFFMLKSTRIPMIRAILLRITNAIKDVPLAAQPYLSPKTKDEKILSDKLREIDTKTNQLIADEKFDEAIELIDQAIKDRSMASKLVGLLTLKARVFSSNDNISKAIETNIELLNFRESKNNKKEALASLCLTIAQQYAQLNDQESAKEYARRSLSHCPGFPQSIYFLENLDGGELITEFQIEEEDNNANSMMIDSDIREHKYQNEEIINNANRPTLPIAKKILEEAKKIKDIDSSARYINYLEAAKAYGQLSRYYPEVQGLFHESIAYYAILKGNYLYTKFRNSIELKNINHSELRHLKDSACSYYIESLGFLAKLPAARIQNILRNYLWVNIAIHRIEENQLVPGFLPLKKLLKNSLEDDSLVSIVCKTIVEVGSASPWAWNRLIKSSFLNGFIQIVSSNENRKSIIYNTINENERISVNQSLKPAVFFKEAFRQRNIRKQAFQEIINDFSQSDFDLHKLASIKSTWDKLEEYQDLLFSTDIEHKTIVDQILKILSPYLNRNTGERTNLLIQTQELIENQIAIINANTTYYGRILFFPLFSKWKKAIQSTLRDKISHTLPLLFVEPDPKYIVTKEGTNYINIIIKNQGESTAEGYIIEIIIKDTVNNLTPRNSRPQNVPVEIPAGAKIERKVNLPKEMSNSQVLEFEAIISAIYQGENSEPLVYQYTVEKEPVSTLQEIDIKWTAGAVPTNQMFKGRQQIIDQLTTHYTSIEKYKTYILYGLTRTGKSSILTYLGESINNASVAGNESLKVIPFMLLLNEIANATTQEEMWDEILNENLSKKFKEWMKNYCDKTIELENYNSARDFMKLMDYMRSCDVYPLIMIDEFSYIKDLMDRGLITPAFLHTMRDCSLNGLCSFIFAGTFDIKELVRNPKYGITGQFVNTIEEQIGKIDESSAEELMNAMDDKLCFTNEAKKHIHRLSGDVPYFIQIICMNCAYFAIENKRMYIGYPELESVIKILAGEQPGSVDSKIKLFPEGTFQNNMYSPTDSPDVNMVLSCIAYLNKSNVENPRGISINEIQDLWKEKNIPDYRARVADAVRYLDEDKKVLTHYNDEGVPSYMISVDIFRRWWMNKHQDINLEFDLLSKN